MMTHFLMFLGTTRDSTPPVPACLALRVARPCVRLLEGDGTPVELIDSLRLEPGGVFIPHFA